MRSKNPVARLYFETFAALGDNHRRSEQVARYYVTWNEGNWCVLDSVTKKELPYADFDLTSDVCDVGNAYEAESSGG